MLSPIFMNKMGRTVSLSPRHTPFSRRSDATSTRTTQDVLFLAEANQPPEGLIDYFGTEEEPECHMAFHFPLMPMMYLALQAHTAEPIRRVMARTPEIPEFAQWALFLRNHDELTLEMVTDQEREELYAYYAPDPQMRFNAGIRRRLAPLMQDDQRKIELLHALLFLPPRHTRALLW